MSFRLPGWFPSFKFNTQSRLGKGFVLLALLLTTITVLTATLVVQQLNDRDLKRLEQVGQLQLKQAAAQLDMLSTRYSMLLAAFAQDDNFIAQATQMVSSGGMPTLALKRLIIANPTVNHVLWLNPQGEVNTSLRRVDGVATWMEGEKGTDIRQVQGLQDILSVQAKEVWFSDFLAIKTTAEVSPNPLIYGGVKVLDGRGETLGYLLIGMDVLRFSHSFVSHDSDLQLPRVALLDAQGTSLGGDEFTRSLVLKLQQSQAKVWAAMKGWQPDHKYGTQASGLGAAGLAWRHVAWGGERAGEFAVIRNTHLNLISWVEPADISRTLQSNANLVTGIWGSGLLLLLIAVGVLYRRSRTVELYREREAAIRRIVDLGYWRFKPSTQHLELSRVFHKTLSLKGNPQELWQAWLTCFDSDADRQAFQTATQNTLMTGQGFELEVLMHNRRNGAKGWGLFIGNISREPGNQGWIEGSVQNITKRKQAEISAEAFRSNLRNIVDWARLGVWEFDLVNGERRINKYLRDMLGLNIPMTGDFLVFNWAPLSHPDDVPAASQARLDYIAGKTPYYSAQLRVKHSQGHWVSFALEGEHVAFDAQGQPTLIRGTAMDVTELHQARLDAEEANQAKTRFLSRMSHELRTPLNAIMGYTQLLRLSPNLDAQEQDHVNAVLAGSRHLLNLVNDLLQITRDHPEALHLVQERVSLSELSQRCTSLMQPLMTEKQLVLDNRISADHWVLADKLRTKQCIINLMANAIKFSPDGSRITLEASQPTQHLRRISVRDQGPGIAPEVGQQVFEPFYRSQDAVQTAEGAGIGLTVSLRLAQQMGGHISYESTVGVGTVFHLDLPAATPEVASTPVATVNSLTPMTTSRTPAPADALAEHIS